MANEITNAPIQRKRKNKNDIKHFEKKPRKPATFSYEEYNDNTKPLLPIKDKSGTIIHQYGKRISSKNKEKVKEDIEENPKKLDENRIGTVEERNVMTVQQRKMQIAHLANLIITNPQENVYQLKKLCVMAEESEPVRTCVLVRKLTIASLRCIFIDIIPGYKIRQLTEEERKVKLSKDVKKRVQYEDALLRYYQKYLEILERAVLARKKLEKRSVISKSNQLSISTLAVKSLCDLFAEASHFNFHTNIIKVLVPLVNDKDMEISTLACDAVSTLFRTDIGGERSLATIKVICEMVKSKALGKNPIHSKVLDTFLNLSIHRVDFDVLAKYKNKKTTEDHKKKEKEKKKMSKKQLKWMKKNQELQSELREAEATTDRDEKLKINTEIVQEIFLTYFRVLKKRNGHTAKDRLMPSVLEGLSKFAHLINVDFFGDLLNVLQDIVRSGEGTHRQNLCCISTAFQVLSGQGEALNIDPTDFYKYLYRSLLEIPELCHMELSATRRQQRQNLPKSNIESSFQLIQECLSIMLRKRRKQVTLARLLAFVKRISTIAMQMHPPSNATTLLTQALDLLKLHSNSYSLFDVESQSNGTYLPEMNDPDHSFATSACLWEVHTLRRHYCPKVNLKAEEILRFGKKSLTL